MAQVNIIFNGQNFVSDDNLTILDFAKSQGVEIPTLCYDERLAPYGSCFLCVVEVKGARTLIPACATKLREGIEIQTTSKTTTDSRRTALELILSNHYGDCIAPCKSACPAGCDVQGYVGLIANKKYDDALKLIKETIPLPASIGRVCPKFCEEKCRRQKVEEPIAIDYLKRFVADMDLNSKSPYKPALKSKIGKRVAVIGGGPAGLSAAYYLIREGVDVEIFEKKEKLGGMLLYGIPQYRLPKDVLAKEIATIIDLGVKVNYNKVLNRDFTVDGLIKDGFDSVVVACGAWSASKLGVPNEDAGNILDGIKFLENIADGKKVEISGKVAIVGGGNTAFDCARTALRLGAKEVVMVYRRTRDEMPANEVEKDEAEEEGVKFQLLTLPVQIVKDGDKATGMICQKMKLGDADASGRRKPISIEGSEFTENYDFIIAAIGQRPDYNILGDKSKELAPDNKRISYNDKTGQTAMEKVFIAGDYATGAATVVEALAGGKKAALAILKLLQGAKSLDPKKEFLSTREDLEEISEEFLSQWEKKSREKIDVLEPNERKTNFKEIEKVFAESKALREAARCMECGCMDVYQCQLKKYAEDYDAQDNKYKGAVNTPLFDDSSNYLFREPSKCILCGRCVRLCSEKINIGVYGYVKRGFDTIVSPNFGHNLSETDCISCGTCISGCPVGAIVPKVPNLKKVPLKGDIIDSYCFHCSVGCKNSVELFSGSIYEVRERDGYLCGRGRFSSPDIAEDKNTASPNYDKLENFRDAIIYPSPSLSAEDYEVIKVAAKSMNWDVASYYSQNSLWRAFAKINKLPNMDFFTKDIKEKTLVVIAGELELSNPVTINELSSKLKQDTDIILVNKELTVRLKNLQAELIPSIKDLEKKDFSKYDEIVLLLNPISFDKLFGADSAITLYNNLTSGKIKVRTTLFSDSRNIYSFYDADKEIKFDKKRSLYIQTTPNLKSDEGSFIVSELFLDANIIEENSLKLSYSFQDDGTFLNSRNQYYQNAAIGDGKRYALRSIFKDVFGIDKVDVIKHDNLEAEKGLPIDKKGNADFPEDCFIKLYSSRK